MKRILALLISISISISVFLCPQDTYVKKTFDGGLKTYYEMSDETWECENNSYMYRLEISGRMPNAAKDSCFVYLSNIEVITFEQAYMAAGLSSNSEDFFILKEAVLVELR